MSIPLSQEHGINPGLTICPRCGEQGEELILAGNSLKWRCDDCNRLHVAYVGKTFRMACPCGNKYRDGRRFTKVGKFDGMTDRVFSSEPCGTCREELDKFRKIVEDGGAYWRCKDCGSEGVLRPETELVIDARKMQKVEPPDPIGIEFSKKWLCPVCNKAEEEDGDAVGKEG